MKVLVTGLKGFTGKYLEAELKTQGHDVIGLESDLLDCSALSEEIKSCNPSAVAHLAAQSFVHDEDIQQMYTVNVVGTYHLLAALYKHAPQVNSILLASSATVYGNSPKALICESDNLNPANDYAVSKVAMEYMAKLWFQKLPIFMVRPFNYTGVSQKNQFLIPKIVDHFKRKAPIIELGNIDVSREFGDVRSVASIYRQLLESPPVHQTLNICTGQPHTLKEVISLCEEITNHKIEIRVNPAFVRQNEIRELKGDPYLLHQHILHTTAYSLRETLEWMLG